MGISLRWKSACRWRWRCRTADGSVRAHSAQAFPSLHAAIEDAMHNGFSYAMRNSRSWKNAAAAFGTTCVRVTPDHAHDWSNERTTTDFFLRASKFFY
jgi:hypothetical protein